MQNLNQNDIVVEVSGLATSNKKSTIHVLHVDDDPLILEISKLILTDLGNFEIDHACCVDEAFMKLSTGCYDVVVSDYEMPQKNGLQFLKELREQNNKIPFILFTGKGREEVAIEAINLGADGYINKQGGPQTVYGELAHRIRLSFTHRKAEQLFRQSEEKFRKLFELARFSVAVFNLVKHVYVDCNPSFEKMCGYSREEIIGKDQVTKLPASELEKYIQKLLKEGYVEIRGVELVTKFGETKLVDGYFTLVNINGEAHTISNLIDVTEPKKAEEALRNSEAKLRGIVECSSDQIFLLDKNLKYLLVNSSVAAVLGRSPKEIIGKSICEVYGLGTATQFSDNIKTVFKTCKSLFLEEKMVAQGQELFISTSLNPIKDDLGNITAVSGIVRDITERKKAEEEIRQKYDVLERVGESVGAGLAIIEKDYSIFWANKLLRNVMVDGNKKCYDNFNKLDTICPDCGVKKIFEQDASFDSHEYKTVNSKGETVWVELIVTPLRDKEGNVIAALELVVPITERKTQEENLKESEQKYRELANCLPEIVFEADLTGKITFFNQRAFQIAGYTPEELEKGMNMLSFVVPEDRERATQNTKNTLAGKEHSASEYKLFRKNGSIYPALVRTAPIISENKVLGLRGLVIDITEEKKLQDALEESEKRSRAIVANSPIGIATSDSDKYFLSANEAFCKILGYTEDELRKLSFREITHPRDLQESSIKMCELENGKVSSFTLEKRYIRKDGTVIDGKITVSSLRNPNGKPSLFIAELEDITERKKVEERRKALERKVNEYSNNLKYLVDLRTAQLKDANERLVKSERLAAIGELAGMVGHDLRNPLTVIKNAAYFLKKKGTAISESQYGEMLETIDKSIDHSDKIINDLLEYAREIHLEITETTIPTLVESAIRIVHAPDRIQIPNHIHDETVIRVDSDKIMRIFENLIKNAIDAMPEKGTLTITSQKTKAFIEVSFADTGSGISEETLKNLFTPLFTTKAQGMGFGLAICKRFIEAHGGTIAVETELNKGTTFTISFPIKPKVPLMEN